MTAAIPKSALTPLRGCCSFLTGWEALFPLRFRELGVRLSLFADHGVYLDDLGKRDVEYWLLSRSSPRHRPDPCQPADRACRIGALFGKQNDPLELQRQKACNQERNDGLEI